MARLLDDVALRHMLLQSGLAFGLIVVGQLPVGVIGGRGARRLRCAGRGRAYGESSEQEGADDRRAPLGPLHGFSREFTRIDYRVRNCVADINRPATTTLL
ncbi:hypothetical protein ACWEWX_08865, partial [Streptomyces asiaticus]